MVTNKTTLNTDKKDALQLYTWSTAILTLTFQNGQDFIHHGSSEYDEWIYHKTTILYQHLMIF